MSQRPRAADPLLLVVGAVGLVTYALHGFHGTLTRDLGSTATPGSRSPTASRRTSASSTAPGPLAHAIPGVGAWIARLAGFDDVVTMRVVFLVIATACASVVYLLGRDLFGSRARRAGRRGGLPRLPRLHPVRLERPAREDADDAVHRRARCGRSPAGAGSPPASSSAWRRCACRSRSSARSPPWSSAPCCWPTADRVRALAARRAGRCGAGGRVRGVVRAGRVAARVRRRVLLINCATPCPNPVIEDLDRGLAGPAAAYGVMRLAARRRARRAGAALPSLRSCRGARRATPRVLVLAALTVGLPSRAWRGT